MPSPTHLFDIGVRDHETGGWSFLRSMRGTSTQSVRRAFLSSQTGYRPDEVRVAQRKPPTPAQKRERATAKARTDAYYAGLSGTREERAKAAAASVKSSNALRTALASLGYRFKQGSTQGDILAFDHAEQMYFVNDRQGGTISLTFRVNDTGD